MSRRGINTISTGSSLTIHGIFVLLVALCLIPFLLVVSVSLTDETAVKQNGYQLVPEELTTAAYRLLAEDIGQIARSYGITIWVTTIGTLISVVLTATLAYPLYRRDFAFRRFFTIFVVITLLFNGGLVPLYILYNNYLNLRETLTALVLPYLINPFFVIIMRTFFTNTIPDSVIESAKLDGASELRILAGIVFPLSLPAFATIGMFTMLVYWNDWFMSLLFISRLEKMNIQYYLYRTIMNLDFLLRQTAVSADMARIEIPGETARMAMAVVGIGPIVLAYPFFQRYFIKGLTIGAVKG
jgi:putative aldouronate transport system permease protein